MMKTGKNNRFLASILAASMMLTMSPFAFAAADTAEQKEMTAQEQVQPATQNETNANPAVSQMDSQSSEGTNSEALKTEGQSPKDTSSEAPKTEDQSSKDVKPADENTTAGDSTSTSKTPAESENPTESETPTKPEAPKNAAKIGENEYPTVAAAIAAADGSESIVLLRDVTENITINKSLTLNLGGFTLTGTGTETVVKISGENLNIIVKDGTITGGSTDYGGGVNIQNVAGTVTLDNCTITKNEASNAGGGIYIASSGTVKIKNGKITENTATNSGAGIYVTCGVDRNKDGNLSCVLDGVMIETNTSNSTGGGIVASGNHPDAAMVTVEMEDGTSISHNTAKTSLDGYGGGGVYITGSATRFIMNGGTISDNEALCGAGIHSATRDGLEINGGSIVDNVATGDGGGIYVRRYAFKDKYDKLLVANGAIVSNNKAKKNGGGLWIGDNLNATIEKGSQVYNNRADIMGDDIYFSGTNSTLNLPEATEMSGDLILSSDNVPITDWYYDGFKDASTRHRWGEKYSELDIDATLATKVPTYKTGIYYEIFKPVENFKGTIALKAAHAQLFTLTYNVTGDLPEGYTAPTAQSMLVGSKYTVAEVPESVTGTKDGVNGTFTFAGWKDKDGKVLSGEQELKDDITLYGVWTFTKKSSGGGGGGRKPTVTIPDDVPTGLNGDDHYAYIVGYPDKTVRPQNGITRAEVATIFFRLLTDETRNANSTKSNSYSDVAAGAWYNHAVSTLSAMGIVKGDSHGKFNPNAPITRAEFAAIAARFDDKANTTAVDFSDIASHWAKDEISAAANNGWINGYTDGTFRPNNKITRAEAMTLVNRVLKRLPETAEDLHNDMIKWSDNSDTSAWYYLAVQEATNSHYYDLKENKHEKWSKLRETRDWTELEK
ncbi:S-layer homology domain-containing protein [Agathobaculum butyriciproducens]|uniref:S-layer homology domain-containing protein n=1 Tax=Agathobaculum butyriciproducens TaxID=1628085 RepID=UPI002FA3F265